jgi:hypothetical protein
MKSALTIKDLAISKHLVASEMAVVRGGVNPNGGDIDPGYSPGHASAPAVTTPVSHIDVAKMIDDMILQNLRGYQVPKSATVNPL